MSENRLFMVSDRMVNGNINQFMRANPEANPLGLVGLPSSLASLAFVTIINPPVGGCPFRD